MGGFRGVLGSVVAFWVLGWGGAGCVWLFFGVFGGVLGAFGAGWFWRCLGMWGNLLFALVSALCTSVQISIFRG